MNNQFTDKQTDDSNALTTDDREVMNKKAINTEDVKGVLSERDAGRIAPGGSGFSITAVKTVFGALLAITGVFIAVVTAWTVFGIIFGALFVIGGIWLPFSNIGSVRGGSAA